MKFHERYELLKRLGAGAAGEVHLARRRRDDVQVAIKFLLGGVEAIPQSRERFVQEAKLLSRIRHDHVVRVLDAGQAEDLRLWFAMEFVDGMDLGDHVAEVGALEPGETARILRGLADGLATLHAMGVIHRDLKPSNVLMGKDGTARIADFGLAKVASGSEVRTRTGIMLGTPGYMAPELFQGAKASAASDIYSLGVVGLFMAKGEPPFAASDLGAMLKEQARGFRRQDFTTVPDALAELLLAWTANDPARRPASDRLVAEVDDAIGQLTVRSRDLARNLRATEVGTRPEPATQGFALESRRDLVQKGGEGAPGARSGGPGPAPGAATRLDPLRGSGAASRSPGPGSAEGHRPVDASGAGGSERRYGAGVAAALLSAGILAAALALGRAPGPAVAPTPPEGHEETMAGTGTPRPEAELEAALAESVEFDPMALVAELFRGVESGLAPSQRYAELARAVATEGGREFENRAAGFLGREGHDDSMARISRSLEGSARDWWKAPGAWTELRARLLGRLQAFEYANRLVRSLGLSNETLDLATLALSDLVRVEESRVTRSLFEAPPGWRLLLGPCLTLTTDAKSPIFTAQWAAFEMRDKDTGGRCAPDFGFAEQVTLDAGRWASDRPLEILVGLLQVVDGYLLVLELESLQEGKTLRSVRFPLVLDATLGSAGHGKSTPFRGVSTDDPLFLRIQLAPHTLPPGPLKLLLRTEHVAASLPGSAPAEWMAVAGLAVRGVDPEGGSPSPAAP